MTCARDRASFVRHLDMHEMDLRVQLFRQRGSIIERIAAREKSSGTRILLMLMET